MSAVRMFGTELYVSWVDAPCPNCRVSVTFFKQVDSDTDHGTFRYDCRNGHSGQYTRAMDPEEAQATGRHP